MHDTLYTALFHHRIRIKFSFEFLLRRDGFFACESLTMNILLLLLLLPGLPLLLL